MFLKYSSTIYKVEINFLNYSVHNLITKESYDQDTANHSTKCRYVYTQLATRSAERHILEPTIIILQQATYHLHHACTYVLLSNSNIILGKEAVRVSLCHSTVCFNQQVRKDEYKFSGEYERKEWKVL